MGSVNLQQGDLQDTRATLTTLLLLLQVWSLHFEQAPGWYRSQALSSQWNQDLHFRKMSKGLMCTLKFEQDYDKGSPEVTITGFKLLIGQTQDTLGGESPPSCHPIFPNTVVLNWGQLYWLS